MYCTPSACPPPSCLPHPLCFELCADPLVSSTGSTPELREEEEEMEEEYESDVRHAPRMHLDPYILER